MALSLADQGKLAKEAAYQTGLLTTEAKNHILKKMSGALTARQDAILQANRKDMEAAGKKNIPASLLDRLMLNPGRIEDMSEGLLTVMSLPDPVGQVESMWTGAQEIQIGKIRVPLGVIGIIYESRPNVTADAAGLCLKTGNAVILRGGADAFLSNQAIATVLSEAAVEAGAPIGAVQLVQDPGRESARELMRMKEYLDVLIPRGGAGLIREVVENSTVPVIETGTGNCHIYIDAGADLEMGKSIILNAKTQRPGVCNAAETLLVHQSEAEAFLPGAAEALEAAGVELRGCPRVRQILPHIKEASEADYEQEFLDLILAIKVVDSLEDAMAHIRRYGTRHSESIITRDYRNARIFLKEVDAACVYVNASTRFTDGFQFGFGAEIGISTQKLHARGPMGLNELTTIKYIIYGDGQVRS
ncbi:MAG: glutamate-5-semialdehyde dehydrogenase [Peptococcaceae bacterium]|nr:glutamate-5-semialdehyde dehydrogenase [Peptococcaceae bacterium]